MKLSGKVGNGQWANEQKMIKFWWRSSW